MKKMDSMRLRGPLNTLVFLSLMFATNAWSTPYLFDWGINIDGNTTCWLGSPVSPCTTEGAYLGEASGVNDLGLNYDTGLGSVLVTLNAPGSHYVSLYMDHEFGTTYFDETAMTLGVSAGGQSWEMDEPGFFGGDIFDNFVAGTLDNSIGPLLDQRLDDVAMALGWSIMLNAGESALLRFDLSQVQPVADFTLVHLDPGLDKSVYMTSSLQIVENPVPAPGTLLLILGGLLATSIRNRRIAG